MIYSIITSAILNPMKWLKDDVDEISYVHHRDYYIKLSPKNITFSFMKKNRELSKRIIKTNLFEKMLLILTIFYLYHFYVFKRCLEKEFMLFVLLIFNYILIIGTTTILFFR